MSLQQGLEHRYFKWIYEKGTDFNPIPCLLDELRAAISDDPEGTLYELGLERIERSCQEAGGYWHLTPEPVWRVRTEKPTPRPTKRRAT